MKAVERRKGRGTTREALERRDNRKMDNLRYTRTYKKRVGVKLEKTKGKTKKSVIIDGRLQKRSRQVSSTGRLRTE